jgi:hypothetical protein
MAARRQWGAGQLGQSGRNGFDVGEVSEKTGLTLSTLSKVENDKIARSLSFGTHY